MALASMTPYLQAEGLSKSFADRQLFSGLSFTVMKEQRVGLVARNGTGKSTLLRMVAGLESSDTGSVVWQNGLRMGYLDQYPILDSSLSLIDNVFQGLGPLSEVISGYEKALSSGNSSLIASFSDQMERHQAWDTEVKAKQILTRLSLSDVNRKATDLSGGQQKRVALARTLISAPDVLILDEPTNHLDLDMTAWLEEFLANSKCTLLMVTHDRYFLDRVCSDIVEIDHGQLYWYRGNYRYFLEKQAERVSARDAQTSKARNLLVKEAEWMRRMPQARTTKAKYRIDAFYELRNKASANYSQRDVNIKLASARLGNKILEAINLEKSYDQLLLLNGFSLRFNRFDRLGILGPNGSGKTTLLKLLTGELSPDKGSIEIGETVVFGYYRQEGLLFDEQMKVVDAVQQVAEVVTVGNGKVLTAMQLLTMFLFPPEVQHSYIYKLSGGEKRRLYLLTILMRSPNFLILDEPTNDLDIETLQVLEEYLHAFPGVVLVVSHDRYFLDKTVDSLLIFEGNGEVSGFPGTCTEYREWSLQQQREAARAASRPELKSVREKGNSGVKLTFAEKRELEALTLEIAKLEKEKEALTTEMDGGALSHTQLAEKSARIGELLKLLDTKEMRCLELMEKEGGR